MPVYTIGKNHQPVSPAATKMDDQGLKPDKNITNEEVNKWFDDAFRKFMQDPYVELNPGNLSDCTGFYTLSMDDENGLSLKNIRGLLTLEQADLTVKKALYQASRDGHLFYWDRSLGESGGMRQIYTKTSEVNGKMEQELCVTDDIREFPQIAKPEAPAFWKYLLAIFSQTYRSEIREYNTKAAQYEDVNTYSEALLEGASAQRHVKRMGLTPEARKKMLDNKQERIHAYERGKNLGVENENFKSPAEFVQEMKEYAKKSPTEVFHEEFLNKENPTVGDFYRGLVKIMMAQAAKITMGAYEGQSDEQIMNGLKDQQVRFRALEKGLRAYVPTQVDMNKVAELCKPMATGLREVLAYKLVTPFSENGLNDYFESLPKAVDIQKKEMEQKQLENNEIQQNNPVINPFAK